MLKIFKSFLFILIPIICFANSNDNNKASPTLTIFPLKNYNQNIAHWIHPTDPSYDKPLLSEKTQQQRLAIFYKHYFGELSPWNANHTKTILKDANLTSIQKKRIEQFSNENKSENNLGYGENFRPFSIDWINKIAKNIRISQFKHFHYNLRNRAITIENLNARDLPTDDAYFLNYKKPGEGFPFDNLQTSSIWIGTPVYIIGETSDRAWSLVLTPDLITWVKSKGIARVNDTFIKTWVKSIKKHAVAITHTETSIIDTNNIFQFTAYVGTLFPGQLKKHHFKIMIPVANKKHYADIHYAFVSKQKAALMPLAATPHHFSRIMQTLIGRPYGWGNLYFYNDCSAELKNLYTPFGIWLPRHSSEQVHAGKFIDLSDKTPKARMDYLMKHGHAFTTVIYVNHHVMLYIGNYPNPHSKSHELIPMTFQNKWGFKPKPDTRRAVIGKSVIFPILEQYPEDLSLITQANETFFQISLLDS